MKAQSNSSSTPSAAPQADTYNLAEHAATLAAVVLKTERACTTFRLNAIEYFGHCESVADAEIFTLLVYTGATSGRGTKPQKAALFAAARSSINKLLNKNGFDFMQGEKMTVKSKGKISGKELASGNNANHNEKQNNSEGSQGGDQADQITHNATCISKSAGAAYDDRIFALTQTMGKLNLNSQDVITELFSGLTGQAQVDCIQLLQTAAKPVNAQTLKIASKAKA